jgi:ribosomal protein S3AE
MTTATIPLKSVCAGGDHLHFGVTVNGKNEHIVDTCNDTILGPLTDDEKASFVKVCTKLYKIGRTANATKTAFQSGVTVTL